MGQALSDLRHLDSIVRDSQKEGMEETLCDFSNVIRGLSQTWSDQSGPRRISLFFSEPPDAQNDTDIHGALNALLLSHMTCEFVYLSQPDASDAATQRLGELALLLSGYEGCNLVRFGQTLPLSFSSQSCSFPPLN